MKYHPQPKSLYLITSGQTNPQTTSFSKEFSNVLRLVEAAVAARIDLVQIREKLINARVLYELVEAAVAITRDSGTRLLVNDRADIAAAAGAHGVHLAITSLTTEVVRQTFGERFLIGASTHSFEEAVSARRQGADFVVLGPIFPTLSKQLYGEPLGLEELKRVVGELPGYPVFALGGIKSENVAECFRFGASGVAAISLFNDPGRLREVADEIRSI